MNDNQSEPLWVMEVPVISTAHLPPETLEYLTTRTSPYDMIRLLHPCGVILFVASVPPKSLPEDLRTCVEWAQDSRYEWLRFDNNGTTIDGLPIYEWE